MAANNNNNVVTMTSEGQLWELRQSILDKTNAGEFTSCDTFDALESLGRWCYINFKFGNNMIVQKLQFIRNVVSFVGKLRDSNDGATKEILFLDVYKASKKFFVKVKYPKKRQLIYKWTDHQWKYGGKHSLWTCLRRFKNLNRDSMRRLLAEMSAHGLTGREFLHRAPFVNQDGSFAASDSSSDSDNNILV